MGGFSNGFPREKKQSSGVPPAGGHHADGRDRFRSPKLSLPQCSSAGIGRRSNSMHIYPSLFMLLEYLFDSSMREGNKTRVLIIRKPKHIVRSIPMLAIPR